MFTVATHSRGLIEATLSGFLSITEVSQYAQTVEAAIARTMEQHGGYAMLLDVSGCAIQSQAVLNAFVQHTAGVPRARRCAVVIGQSPIRMQVRRIIHGPTMRMAADRAEAWAWLTERVLAAA